jgi:hypothetical protein
VNSERLPEVRTRNRLLLGRSGIAASILIESFNDNELGESSLKTSYWPAMFSLPSITPCLFSCLHLFPFLALFRFVIIVRSVCNGSYCHTKISASFAFKAKLCGETRRLPSMSLSTDRDNPLNTPSFKQNGLKRTLLKSFQHILWQTLIKRGLVDNGDDHPTRALLSDVVKLWVRLDKTFQFDIIDPAKRIWSVLRGDGCSYCQL